MQNEKVTEEKKVRVARNLESITKGALSLPLADRVKLAKELQEKNIKEVADLRTAAEDASKLIGA